MQCEGVRHSTHAHVRNGAYLTGNEMSRNFKLPHVPRFITTTTSTTSTSTISGGSRRIRHGEMDGAEAGHCPESKRQPQHVIEAQRKTFGQAVKAQTMCGSIYQCGLPEVAPTSITTTAAAYATTTTSTSASTTTITTTTAAAAHTDANTSACNRAHTRVRTDDAVSGKNAFRASRSPLLCFARDPDLQPSDGNVATVAENYRVHTCVYMRACVCECARAGRWRWARA